MKVSRVFLVAAALLGLASAAHAAADERDPHVGYLYPAGGRQGTTIRIAAGGQRLRGAGVVYVSGAGVHASAVSHAVTGRPLTPDQMRELRRRLRDLVEARLAEGRPGAQARRRAPERANEKPESGDEKAASLPDHPFLRDLDALGLRELKKVSDFFFDPNRVVQANPQIAETVEIEVTIDPGAPPGERELRIATPAGLSNPVLFQVGTLPEVCEKEIDDFKPMVLPDLDGPIVLNGQIYARDIDRFRFKARRGQRLVFAVEARRLIPYLADAVPGWFQAVISLRDGKGKEVGFADDYRFDPDPILYYEVPEDGDYELEVRDAIYRGRQDFVYRITMGEVPFVTRIFPLGGPAGVSTTAAIAGWNLPAAGVPLDTGPAGGAVRALGSPLAGGPVNRVLYAVDDLPECWDREPNDIVPAAQAISLPIVVNGRIDRSGDVDIFRFEGRAGEVVAAEVFGRRLGSPIDSWLELCDASGRVLVQNDDHLDKEAGLVTHQADSYVRFKLPADGAYVVRLAETQRHGGEEYAYRLRIGAARPDFALIVTPASLNVPAGSVVPFTVHAIRKDGFSGDIEVALKDAPPGYALGGATVPAGEDEVCMTLRAPRGSIGQPIPLVLEGRARIGGRMVSRPAAAAEDMMQAFDYRHLVRAQALLVTLTRFRLAVPPMELAAGGPVRLREGSTARVEIRAARLPALDRAGFQLADPPPGVTLGGVETVPGGLAVTFRAEKGKVKAGAAGNLIVEVHAEIDAPRRQGGAAKKPPAKPDTAKPEAPSPPAPTRRVYIGTLPAIPFVVEPG